ncbi:hypothetical protein H4S02_000536, partial [Coemansia sp. RSA 2611]
NNTFGATAFSSFGGFWMSYAVIISPGFDVLPTLKEAGGTAAAHGIGIFLMGWVIMTFILFLATLRTNLGLCLLFAFLDITFILLCAGEWTGVHNVTKAGGYFGLFTALIAWYIAASDLITRDNSVFTLPNPSLARNTGRNHLEDGKTEDGN